MMIIEIQHTHTHTHTILVEVLPRIFHLTPAANCRRRMLLLTDLWMRKLWHGEATGLAYLLLSKWPHWCNKVPSFPLCIHSHHPRYREEPAWALSSSGPTALPQALPLRTETVLASRVVMRLKPVGTCKAHCLAYSKCSKNVTVPLWASVSSSGEAGVLSEIIF